MYTLNSELKAQLVNHLNSLSLHWDADEAFKLTDGAMTVFVTTYGKTINLNAKIEGEHFGTGTIRFDLKNFDNHPMKKIREKKVELHSATHSSGGDESLEAFDTRIKSMSFLNEVAKVLRENESAVIKEYEKIVAIDEENRKKEMAEQEEKRRKAQEAREQFVANFQYNHNCLDEKAAKAFLASVKADAAATRQKVTFEVTGIQTHKNEIYTLKFFMFGHEDRLCFYNQSMKKVSLKDMVERLTDSAAERIIEE